ncbi:MAG: hypothetical protein OEY56_03765 [Cyclobacteriaceae bacterium]|nr:hypothetical protein [Cyclobacteriaceae bacterium]
MEVKYSKHFLNRLEDLFSETDYVLRYEKGNFHSGYCILKETKIAIVNKYFPLDGKINSLMEILRTITVETDKLSEKNAKLLTELKQNQITP